MAAVKPRFNVAFPPEVMAELNGLVPARERNRFVVEAVRERLRRERLRQLLEEARRDPIWKDEDHPDLLTPEDVAEYIRLSRARWTAGRFDDE
jgi:hypothetical protein